MRTFIKNILVPTDFSEQGNHAINIAIDLCKQNNAVLHLLHVVENRYIITAPEPGISVTGFLSEIDQNAREMLYNVYESIVRDHDITLQIHMPTGIPFDEICKAASEMPIDLIVMGTHGASGAREFFMGSTAYSVIKNTTKPVLTIPGDFEASGFKKILFPVRPVQGIIKKYEFIQPFLKTQDVSVHVAVLCQVGKEEQLYKHNDDLYEILTSLESKRVTCTRELYACKNFASKVLELSEILAVDLIIINATLDFKWTQFFIGPYTQQVVNNAKVPVLSYRQAIDVSDEEKKINRKSLEQKKTVRGF